MVAVVKKVVSKFVLLFALFLVCTSIQFVELASANIMPTPPPTVQVYIKADGTVEPATTPIEQVGDVYVFADNLLNHTLTVERDNIVIDGAGFTLKGVGVNTGITLSGRKNVTIKNVYIKNYVSSVWLQQSTNNTIRDNIMLTCMNVVLDSSSNNQIIGNNITGQDTGFGYGVQLNSGSSKNSILRNSFTDIGIAVRAIDVEHNVISGNYFVRGGTNVLVKGDENTISKNMMVNGRDGIKVTGSGSRNSVFGNNVTGKTECGIEVSWGSSNTVHDNQVTSCSVGVSLGYDREYSDREVEDNVFYHNNFINNTQDAFAGWVSGDNSWNKGEKGNYWSSYNGTDIDGDGVGDRAYVINENNADYFPLMEPVEIPETTIPETVPEFPSWIVLPLFFVATLVGVVARRKFFRSA